MNQKKKWFSVEVQSAHMGAGNVDHHTNYVYAKNSIEALSKIKKMRGWKDKGSFPQIQELYEAEVTELEQRISDAKGITLFKAKRFGYYGKREKE